ncbi:MAG TPA: sigma-70 family RNA polymerase sigma factor [Bryobacteraceae bacterium]|nr:sigma-70 family RNA polymerase sigma factor [Bryobacteraceae bacterium]
MAGTTAASPDVAMGDDTSPGEHELPALMIRYQAGDAEAVETLVQRLSPPLRRYLASPYLTTGDTEDLLQDCWMRIHRARHTYSSEEPLMPWIYAIARHVRLDAYRRRRRREAREILTDTPPDRPAGTMPAETDRISRLLENLPESQREVLIMLKVSGMTVEEVARAISSSPGAVKQKAHRGYVRLRELIGKDTDS